MYKGASLDCMKPGICPNHKATTALKRQNAKAPQAHQTVCQLPVFTVMLSK